MKISELVGHLLAELAEHGNSEVCILDEEYGGSREVETIDFFPNDYYSKVVLDVRRGVN